MGNKIMCDVWSPHCNIVEDLRGNMPDQTTFDQCATFFKALSDPTRTRIIWALNEHELCVCDICELLGMTPSAISHQLSGLKKARMVKSRREGKVIYYSLADAHISAMLISGLDHTRE